MQLLAQRQARPAAQRRSGHTKCVINSNRRGAAVSGRARLVAGSRRQSVRVQAEATAVAVPASSPLSIGTIALRKAVAQAAYKGSSIFVTGGQGQLSIRIIRELLAAGFKVTAGVTDLDAATAAFAFFKRYELIDKTAAANLKLVPLSSLEGDDAAVKALPKRAKVIVVDGDVEGKGKTGAKEVNFALALAEATSASQVVLVSTQPGVPAAGGTGLFGGLFGGGLKASSAAAVAKPLDKLGRLEQQVADSGLPYAIVRAYGTDRTDDGEEPGSYLQIGTLGTVPTSAVASKAQIASVVSEVLKAAGPTNGLVFEVSATPDEQLSAADAIGEIIAAAEAAAAEAAATAAEEAAKSAGSAVGLFGLGTMSVLRKATAAAAPPEEVSLKETQETALEPETPAEKLPKKAAGSGFFSFGAKAVAVEQPAAKEEPLALGTLSARRAAAKLGKAVVEEVVVVEEEAPKKTGTGFFGFGSTRVAAKKVAAKEEPKKEEEVPEPPKKVGSGFFGFGTVKVAAKKEEPKEEEEEVPEPPKKVGSGFFGFGTVKVAAKKEEPKKEEEEVPEPPRKAGSGFFGFGTARVAVKKPDEEEEAPVPKRQSAPIRTSSRNVPPPPPPSPAPSPKRSAPSTGTAIRSRVAPPPPEPEPPKRSASFRRAPEPAPEPPKRSASARGRTPEPEPPKRSASAPPAPTRGTSSVSSRSSPASSSSSRSAAPSGTSRTSTSTGTSRTSTPPPATTSTNSRGSRAAPAPEPAPTYVPGTRGARLAAQKAQQQQEQQRRK
ncbi:hypothetical protein VaNZ11_001724 [Volvox africanus]|uniref:NAD(P)-binding domain-containing protein n=1 Tax=Volvox africanus TaxID=51714 RepID=A0ABQ5RQB5_9CHLO|nr:hypothetical protein VaNZ11_001724 [Volvox africanus]